MSRAPRRAATAALGFSVHTGWAVAVLVAAPDDAPQARMRRRLELCADRGEAFVYHRAAELVAAGRPLAEAERLVQAARQDAARRAEVELRALLTAAAPGDKPSMAGIVMGNAKVLPDLAAILNAHPLVHTAEGALFREALAAACRACGIVPAEYPAGTLAARAAECLGLPAARLPQRLSDAGKALGRPWARDEKDACLAAWLALAGTPDAA